MYLFSKFEVLNIKKFIEGSNLYKRPISSLPSDSSFRRTNLPVVPNFVKPYNDNGYLYIATERANVIRKKIKATD